MSTGLQGSAAEAFALKSDLERESNRLAQARLAELTPEQLAMVRAIGEKRNLKLADGLQLDDDQDAVVNKKVNEVMHATLRAHDAELAAAQRAFEAKKRSPVK
jgi:hypothetical protein